MCRLAQYERYDYEYMTRPVYDIDFAAFACAMGANGKTADGIARVTKILNEYEYDKPLVIDLRI